MSMTRLVAASTAAVLAVCAAYALAADISAKKIFIKDNSDATKRQIVILSKDLAIMLADADDPGTNGAILHLYSATDDYCTTLAAGSDWVSKPTTWKYKNKTTKNQAQVKNGKILVKIKSNIGFTLDEASQGAVNAVVQFGTGTRYCMRCTGNGKDVALKFLGKNCTAAPCDPEPSACPPATTSTTGGPTTTTTTTMPSGGTVLKGALLSTPGRFNFNLTLGLPGADSACNSNFPGTHACSVTDLNNAQAAGDLVGLKDIGANMVTSFWAISGTAPDLNQCNDDALGGSALNWEYGTAHTVSRGGKLPLDNATGTLQPLQSGLQCNFSGNAWVGCCL